jgi:hypothetical protein
MFYGSSKQVFIYDKGIKNQTFSPLLRDFHNFNAFTSGNIYQLHRYAQTITPQVLLFYVTDAQSLVDLDTIIKHRQTDYPLIVILSANMQAPLYPQIAHYIAADNNDELVDIIESYNIGGKKHNVMLIDTYSPSSNPLKTALKHKGYSIFEVHNIEAAKHYLARNKPQVIGVEYVPTFIPARHTLQHSHIFYVDRAQDITEIEKFLH